MVVDTSPHQQKQSMKRWIFVVLLIFVLFVGIYLRTRGLIWGEYQYLHPDERFLVWVGTDISPVESLSAYWDTARSTLNPHNQGHNFYVYGTLPMFIARYLVEWIYGHSGFQEMTNVGRALSASADILTVLLVYLIGKHVYGRRVGILAAAFSAFAVLHIQLSHYFTMDTFSTFFSALTVFFAVKVAINPMEESKVEGAENPSENEQSIDVVDDKLASSIVLEDKQAPSIATGTRNWSAEIVRLISDPLFFYSLGFGIALGMAVASKINAAPLAFLLPGALLIRVSNLTHRDKSKKTLDALLYMVFAGLVSAIVFRVFQPYAFQGPGFFGVIPNSAWIDNLRELQNLTGGDADFPPAMQWARRPIWFSWQNCSKNGYLIR